MSTYEIISSLISVLAVVISVVALVRARKNDKRLLELEEVHAEVSRIQIAEHRERVDAKAKADLQLEFKKRGPSTYEFVISNIGHSTATQIHFSLDDNNEHNPLVSGDYDRKLPYPLLNRGNLFTLMAVIPLEISQQVYHCTLTWTNTDGSQDKRSFSVCGSA